MTTKSILLNVQAKGGTGKSTSIYSYANYIKTYGSPEEIESTIFVDMDETTNTSTDQLQFYPNSLAFSFLDEKTKEFDRSRLDAFLEQFISAKKINKAICDLGAQSSEEIKNSLSDKGTLQIFEVLSEEVDIEFRIMVAGENMFAACVGYARELLTLLKSIPKIKKTIVLNEYFPFTQEQELRIVEIAKDHNAKLIRYNTVSAPNKTASIQFKTLMTQGLGMDQASPLTKIRLLNQLEQVEL